jgi:cbb3-type cytochrome oxidase maturation protein
LVEVSMEVLYLLVPLAAILVIVIVAVFFWAIKSGQFDDLEGPAHRILMDDDGAPPRAAAPEVSAPGDRSDEK